MMSREKFSWWRQFGQKVSIPPLPHSEVQVHEGDLKSCMSSLWWHRLQHSSVVCILSGCSKRLPRISGHGIVPFSHEFFPCQPCFLIWWLCKVAEQLFFWSRDAQLLFHFVYLFYYRAHDACFCVWKLMDARHPLLICVLFLKKLFFQVQR